MANVETLIDDTEEKMMGAIEALERDFGAYRTGMASPSLVEGLMVDYYGTQTRLKDIAGITTPEPRLLVIQPWDQNAIQAIEKAIQASDVGISPQSDGRVIRLPIPELTEERRRDLGKQVKKRAEEGKVALRNLRRDANEAIKKYLKSSDISEDDHALMLKNVQDLTDKYTKEIEDLTEDKEKDIMSI